MVPTRSSGKIRQQTQNSENEEDHDSTQTPPYFDPEFSCYVEELFNEEENQEDQDSHEDEENRDDVIDLEDSSEDNPSDYLDDEESLNKADKDRNGMTVGDITALLESREEEIEEKDTILGTKLYELAKKERKLKKMKLELAKKDLELATFQKNKANSRRLVIKALEALNEE